MDFYYRGHPNIKRAGVLEEWDEYKLSEYKKCMNDPIYFIENYVKVIHVDEGMILCKLYPYQKEMVHMFTDNRFNVIMACRQSGKTTGVVGYILWHALFHADEMIAILANKGETARGIMQRVMLALENIPFFLQPGAREYNKSSILFDNNTQIVARSTSNDSVRGMSATLLYIDEVAAIQNAMEFYTATYPIISAGKTTKVILTSTPKGVGNLFHKMYSGAVHGTNEFKHMRVDWWDVPGRDEEWKEQQIANTSERQFAQEFGNEFLTTGNTLINGNALLGMVAQKPIKTEQDGDLKFYEKPQEGHSYMIGVDTSKGRGQDYSAFIIVDITVMPWKQVAVYRNNLISPLVYPNIIWRIAQYYNDAYIIVENNEVGQTVAEVLWYDLEYENMYVSSTIKSSKSGRSSIGLNMNKKIKHIGCSHLKDIVEEGKLEIIDADTISEFTTFVARRNSWEAARGANDDLVMSLVGFAWFTASSLFNETANTNLREFLYETKMEEIDNTLVLAPVVVNEGDEAEDQRKYENIDIDVPENFVRYDDWYNSNIYY